MTSEGRNVKKYPLTTAVDIFALGRLLYMLIIKGIIPLKITTSMRDSGWPVDPTAADWAQIRGHHDFRSLDVLWRTRDKNPITRPSLDEIESWVMGMDWV